MQADNDDWAIVDRGPFEMVPHWILFEKVSSNSLRLYMLLRKYGDQRGRSFPGRKTLALQMDVSASTVDRCRVELSQVGAICFRNRTTERGDWTSNEYHVHWDRQLHCSLFDQDIGGYPAGDDTRPAGDDTGMFMGGERTNTQLEPKPTQKKHSFDVFWSIYPKRVAKGSAVKAWHAALKKADLVDIIDGARRYRDDPNRDPMFTANPATWLNGERWADEYLAPKSRGPVTIMDLYADEPCKHGDPLGEDRCPLCRKR